MLIAVTLLLGTLVVGPLIAHAVLHWVGWRVYLPFLFGGVPKRPSARAACRSCNKALSPAGLPALPWLTARGRCRSCKEPIARWVLGIELTTGAALGLIAWQVGWSTSLAPALALATGLIAISAVDMVYSRIPTRFVYLTALAVVVTGIPRLVDVPDSAIGAAVGGGLCLVSLGTMHLASPQMLGFGDVRLATLIGATVGWLSWTADEPVFRPLGHVVSAMILAGLLGSVIGVVLLVIRRRNVAYPFGPCLAAGAVAVLLL